MFMFMFMFMGCSTTTTMSTSVLTLLLCFFFFICPSQAATKPYALRLSCGALEDVRAGATNTLWRRDFGYTGGVSANATHQSFITPNLPTLRVFPLSDGPQNCYIITHVPTGLYAVRIFFGLVLDSSFDTEPLFDVSIEGTLVDSLSPGWSTHSDERVFTEALVFLRDGSASLCFHSTGHGDPAVISIEILQVNDKSYKVGPVSDQGSILKTVKRVSCGGSKPMFDEDYGGDPWGGDRFWNSMMSFGQSSERVMLSQGPVKKALLAPNFYPKGLYETALVSSDTRPDLTYTMDVEPNGEYSVWLHFAEIDPDVTEAGQRIFDILINGDFAFKGVDVVAMSGGVETALVLNTSVFVDGRSLIISLVPVTGSHAIINAIEVFKIIPAEAKTLPVEVNTLQSLKKALLLPLRLGWNGDPCVPQQHPWTGATCQFDSAQKRWFIDGLGLDNQGLHGYLPDDISQLSHLQSLNLSGNSIHGKIPPSLGTITSMQDLDLSYNLLEGRIPENLGQLKSLRTLNLNGNKLSGRVPAPLGERLLYRASFNFTDNAGLCGIPGLHTCGPHLSPGAKIGIAVAALLALLCLAGFMAVWWKRRQNILRAQKIAAREAPYAKKRTHFSHEVQMTLHHTPRTASENGPILLS